MQIITAAEQREAKLADEIAEAAEAEKKALDERWRDLWRIAEAEAQKASTPRK